MDDSFKVSVRGQYPSLCDDNTMFEHPVGWNKIITKLCKEINRIIKQEDRCRITLFKQKWAELRVGYICDPPSLNKVIYPLVEYAVKQSKITCEKCGQIGTEQEVDGWFYIYCDNCA